MLKTHAPVHKSYAKARKPLEKLLKTLEDMPKNIKIYRKSSKKMLAVLEVSVKKHNKTIKTNTKNSKRRAWDERRDQKNT